MPDKPGLVLGNFSLDSGLVDLRVWGRWCLLCCGGSPPWMVCDCALPWVQRAIGDGVHVGDGGWHADTGIKSAHLKRRCQYKTNVSPSKVRTLA